MAEKAAKVVAVAEAKVSRQLEVVRSSPWEFSLSTGGRGRGRGRRGQRPKEDAGKTWVPVTKLGRLVNDNKIHSIEEIYLFSLPIKVRSAFSPSFISDADLPGG